MMRAQIVILLVYPLFLFANSWPQWRGPDGSGHASGNNYPKTWTSEDNVMWKQKIPGRGHSSPVHEKGSIWITTALETPASEKEKEERLKENGGLSTVTVLSKVSLRAIQVDPILGEILQNIEIFEKEQPQWVHHLNSYASPTPFIEQGKLYMHFQK